MKFRSSILSLAFLAAACIQPVSAGEMSHAWEAFDGGDYATARMIWRKLAANGDDEAMVALAGMAGNGTGQSRNPGLSRRLYLTAANLGNPDAMQNLAAMMECGRGGPTDLQSALMWYRKAAGKGRAWASRQVRRLAGPEQKSAAPCQPGG